MPLTTLYLVRHGETAWNLEHRWQGQLDVPLTQIGVDHAQRLADHLRLRPITTVVSSDLSRASQTADIIAAALGLTTQVDARWREMHLGVLQGLTHDEILMRYPHEMQGLNDSWLDHRIEGGESRRDMQVRLIASLSDIVASAPGPEAVIVAHGGVVRVVLRTLFPDDLNALHKPIENTSFSTLGYAEGAWTLLGVSETPHLRPHFVEGEQEAQ